MKFAVVNLGCKVNKVEADSFAAELLAAGWQAVSENADVAIVNTCTVTAEADKKTRKEVHRAIARNPQARILVTGCAAAMDPAVYTALNERVEVLGKNELVASCLNAVGQENKHKHELGYWPGHEYGPEPTTLRLGAAFPTRVGIKVQDGCNNACTFCIVHTARGKATSMPAAWCLEQAQAYACAGVKEIVLTGIDLGAYTYEGLTFAGLLRQLRTALPDVRLRISSIEPHTLSEEVVEQLVEADGMICRHVHLPLQSGSSKVLHEMARHYSAEDYLSLVAQLRKAVPSLSLTTDVIAGFPGEAEDDFNQTLEVARACGFSRMHIFRYSKREGTPAAVRSDQVPAEVKAARSKLLEGLAEELRRADAVQRIGSIERVLVESSMQGMSESYFSVNLPKDVQRGSLIECRLSKLEKDGTFSL